jgi:hypothetical protein
MDGPCIIQSTFRSVVADVSLLTSKCPEEFTLAPVYAATKFSVEFTANGCSSSITTIVIAVIGSVLALAVFVFIVCLLRKRAKKQQLQMKLYGTSSVKQ